MNRQADQWNHVVSPDIVFCVYDESGISNQYRQEGHLVKKKINLDPNLMITGKIINGSNMYT